MGFCADDDGKDVLASDAVGAMGLCIAVEGGVVGLAIDADVTPCADEGCTADLGSAGIAAAGTA